MILYQPPQNRSWKPLRGKALRLLIFNTSAVERQRFERKRSDPIPPPFPYPGKGGGSGGYIPRRALGGSTAGTASQGCGAPPRSGGFALDRQPRLCYWVARRRGIHPAEPPWRKRGNGRVPSGHGVQKIYKNTAPIFVGSDVLRKVDSPLNCCVFVCSC